MKELGSEMHMMLQDVSCSTVQNTHAHNISHIWYGGFKKYKE